MKRLGVNIDHVATIRNARGENHPEPLRAAQLAMKYGASSITIHLREDRRHINDLDVKNICKNKKIPVNLEISLNNKILNIALKNKPNFICIVPEERKEITTEGGLNLYKNRKKITNIIKKFKAKHIRTSLFIDPNIKNIILSKKIKTDCVEFHTGKISNLIKLKKNYQAEFIKIKKCAEFASSLGIEVHAGHGMNYTTAKILNKINLIKEFNIGHFIISESIFDGFKKVIQKIKKISNN
jgi:pyridoxine 5-phosphate synthase